MRLPLRVRLTAIYCAVFCASAMALELGAYAALTSAIHLVVDSELLARTDGVAGFLDEHVARRTLPKLQAELASHTALQPDFVRVSRAPEGEIFRGRAVAQANLRVAGMRAAFFDAVSAGRPLRILTVRRAIKGQPYELAIAADVTGPAEMQRRFRWLIFLSSPLVFICAAFAGYWISRRALMPVARLTGAAQSISAANLSARLAVPDSGDEIQSLAETLNSMLGRIESAFRHVTQFTANASHELRTPLALIRTTAEVALLRNNATADSYREALHRILREAERNSALLDDMLRLARADASAGALAPGLLQFGPHIEQLCERVQPLAEEKNIRLQQTGGGSAAWIRADEEHLKRLWLILLDNAMKYTPPGGRIDVAWWTVGERELVCEVRDTGIGIAAADLPHIFERFYRADKARNREDGGAGLGLALARWIVEAHHARIQVESTLGVGSVFRVLLPLEAGWRNHQRKHTETQEKPDVPEKLVSR